MAIVGTLGVYGVYGENLLCVFLSYVAITLIHPSSYEGLSISWVSLLHVFNLKAQGCLDVGLSFWMIVNPSHPSLGES